MHPPTPNNQSEKKKISFITARGLTDPSNCEINSRSLFRASLSFVVAHRKKLRNFSLTKKERKKEELRAQEGSEPSTY